MRGIFRFKEWVMIESLQFHGEELIDLKLEDELGTYLLTTKMIETGCSIDRRMIFYKFKIVKTDSPQKYPIDSVMIFPIDFDKQTFNFLIEIPDDRYNMRTTSERHYHATVQII